MITTRTRNSLVGADFSAQEPRSLAAFSKDKEMVEAYNDGKDLYAVIASKCFHNNYWNNIEFEPIYFDVEPFETELTGKIIKFYVTDEVFGKPVTSLKPNELITKVSNDGKYVTAHFKKETTVKVKRKSRVDLVQNQENKARRAKSKMVLLGRVLPL